MRRWSGRNGVFDGFGRISTVFSMVVCHGTEKSGGEAKDSCRYAI